jgi:hypothetical protein
MTLDIETALRETLTQRAGHLTASIDPWQTFERRDRRHRRGRRARIAAVTVASVAVIGVVGSGVVPLPHWVPALTIQPASSPLLDGPPAGSLAADQEWLTAFRARIPELLADTWASDSDGHWKVDDVDEIQVIFAGDVNRQRMVAAMVPLRTGLLRSETTAWFRGPFGAAPDQMEQDSSGEALTEPYVGRVDGEGNRANVLVLAQEESLVEVSGSVEFRSDGTVSRSWTTVPRQKTGEYSARVPATGMEAMSLRVTTPGDGTETRKFDLGNWSDGNLRQRLEVAIDDSTTQLDDAHRELARTLNIHDLSHLGLEPTDINITTLWAGEVDGLTAILLAVQPTNGGVLLFAHRGGPISDGAYSTEDLFRLLAPADEAYTRPYAWRMRESENVASGDVFVVAPEGADSAAIRLADGTSIPVDLDKTGAGMVRAQADRMTVIAYDSTGAVIGETPVPPFESEYGVPGETKATSVVLNEE